MRRPVLRTGRALAAFAAVSWVAAAHSPAVAHTGGTVSYGQWRLSGTSASLSLRVRPVDFRGLPAEVVGGDLGSFLLRSTVVASAGGPCAAEPSTGVGSDAGWVTWHWCFRCEGAAVVADFEWMNAMPGHLHIARIDGGMRVLHGGRTAVLDLGTAEPRPGAIVAAEFSHGLRHIAAGWDHLAFLAGLLLLASRPASLAALATGFTAGHSASLLLATRAGMTPPSVSVEIAIAASILMVGVPSAPRAAAAAVLAAMMLAAAWVRPADAWIWAGLFALGVSHLELRRIGGHREWPVAGLVLACVFGLLHGFGFATAVVETARSASLLWPVLLGFNLGVEAGQLAVLLPAWWLLHRASATPLPAVAVRALVCGAGAFWVTERLLQAV